MIVALVVIALELYALLDNMGLLELKYKCGFFGYYTNLSNILVLGYFILKALKIQTNVIVDFSVMMSITVTFLIYHFMIFPSEHTRYKEGKLTWNLFGPTNMLLHYVNPLLTIFYWLFFCDKTEMKWYYGLSFLLVPTIYCIYILIRKMLNIPIDKHGNIYPYEFMDVDKYGLKAVSKNIFFLLIGFGLLGMAVTTLVTAL